jgi:hypothetical protein
MFLLMQQYTERWLWPALQAPAHELNAQQVAAVE